MLILLQDFLISAFDILTCGWTTLPVASFYKSYYAISLPTGKRVYICNTFQSKGNECIEYVLISSHLIQNKKY